MKNIQFKPKCFFYSEENMFFFLRNYKEFWHLPVRIWWCDIANKTKENSQKGKKNDFKESYSSFITSFLINKAIIIFFFNKKLSLDSSSMMTPTISSNEKQSYTMYRQPIPTDRLCMYDVSPSEASGTSILFCLIFQNMI